MMQILKTDCPACGATHDVIIQPAVAAQEAMRQWSYLREQLANAHTAMRCARDMMDDEQYDAAALVLDNAMEVRRT